jgi:uncharacterized protein (DUF1697 family)
MMPTYVAFLRAINVTGRFLKMSALAEAFHSLGHADARTHINSGNVIFSASKSTAKTLQNSLELQLEPLIGFRSEVFLRSVDEVKAISALADGMKGRVSDEGDINVCFLQSPLSAAQRAELDKLKTDVDDFELGEREVYWLCQTRQSSSKFSNAVLERKLKARSTLRRASMLSGLVEGL